MPMGVLRGLWGKGQAQNRQIESEFPSATCDLDLKHAFPCYWQEALDLGYFEYTKPRDTPAESGCSIRQGPLGREEPSLVG